MALFKDDPTQATRWFFERGILPDAASNDGQGQFYVPRQAYGAFVGDTLERSLEGARKRVGLRHLRSVVSRVTHGDCAWRVMTADRDELDADIVAFCFGHAAPASPCPIGVDVAASSKFVPDPWARRALFSIGPTDSVLIVGTGLTMADVVVSLYATGHHGTVTAISRRGLIPRGHGLFATDVDLFQGMPPPTTAMSLLRLLRRRIRESDPALGWQPIIDSLRCQLPTVWNGLPADEQRRVQRRLLPFWDVHRFRIAPQVGAVLARSQTAGSLSIERAGLEALACRQNVYVAAMRRADGKVEERCFDAVVLCTGPDKNVAANPLIAALLTEGAARLDRTGLGLAVDRSSHVVDAEGRPVPGLVAFGPMTRGSFGEMTGAPDIAKHIEQVAGELLGGSMAR